MLRRKKKAASTDAAESTAQATIPVIGPNGEVIQFHSALANKARKRQRAKRRGGGSSKPAP